MSVFLAVVLHADDECGHALDSCCQLTLPSVDSSDTTRSTPCANVMNGRVRSRPLKNLACAKLSKFGRHTDKVK